MSAAEAVQAPVPGFVPAGRLFDAQAMLDVLSGRLEALRQDGRIPAEVVCSLRRVMRVAGETVVGVADELIDATVTPSVGGAQ